MKIHYNIRVWGRVQGVGYRFNCKREAKAMGITGFVKNRPDGSVYIEAEGDASNLEIFVSRCKKGPTYAHVDKVHINKSEPVGFSEFKISY
ncbi:MAG: acylphosphatase [Bacteroidota bacterium]|nr:acylphosphatase [Bacteroidota bacterium]